MIQTTDLTDLGTVPFVLLKPIAHSLIKGKAHQAIMERYPYWKQLNIIRAGGDELAEMSKYIDNIRGRSNELEDEITHCRSRACVMAVLDKAII